MVLNRWLGKREAPPLARAMAAAYAARFGPPDDALTGRLSAAVGKLDKADHTYRRELERGLPREHARAMIAALATFRRETEMLRERTRADIDAILANAGVSIGGLDPLDAAMVAPAGATHVDATRIAGLADRSRDTLGAQRKAASAQLSTLLGKDGTERAISAKRTRNAAFERILREALGSDVPDAFVTQLAAMLDTWY